MMKKNTKLKQIKICTWNICLGILHKMYLVKRFIKENDIDILCIQEAEIKAEDNVDLIHIPGFNLEMENTSENFKIRTITYIREGIVYERMNQFEKENAHVICIKLVHENVGLASLYRTYKLTHMTSHKTAFEEQVGILRRFLNTGANNIIMGDFNLDFKRRNDTNYHLRQLYEEMIVLEQEHQLMQLIDFTTWR